VTIKRPRQHHIVLGITAVLLFIAAGPLQFWGASGAELGNRSLQLSDARASATATYRLSFDIQTAASLGSIRVQFCANDPLIGQPCTPPSGFDLSGATLAAQTGTTGFSISGTSTPNVLILTRSAAVAVPGPASYRLDGVINPAAGGSYYARLESFASTDASGPNIDYGGLAFAITTVISVNATVPPYMLLCTGVTIQPFDCATAQGDYVNFGEFRPTQTSTGQTQMLIATNAGNGYTVRPIGTTLTSGNNVIPALSANDISRPGTSQFGFNLRANSTPGFGSNPQGPGSGTFTPNYGQIDFYRFNSGEIIASSTTSDDYRLYTVSYMVNVGQNQPPGVYVTTLTFVALASF